MIFLVRLQFKNAMIMNGDWAKRLRIFKTRVLPFLMVSAVFANISVSIMFIDRYSLLLSQLAVGLLCGISATVVFILIWACLHLILNPLHRDLAAAIVSASTQHDSTLLKRNVQMKKLLKKTKILIRVVQIFGLLSGLILLVFACVPFMMRLIGYALPLLLLAIANIQRTFFFFCDFYSLLILQK